MKDTPINAPGTGKNIWTAGTLTYGASALATLFFFLLLGDFSWSLKERSVFQIVQLMFKNNGASDFLNGLLIMSLPAALGIFVVPPVSCGSDHCRSRWGRRIPYLVITTPIAAGAMVGLAASPELGKILAPVLGMKVESAVLLSLGVFWTIFEIATVVANAIFIALVNDVVPPAFKGRFYGMFRILSLLAGVIFNWWILKYAEVYYVWLFISIGAVYAAGFFIMCFGVREGKYPTLPTESAPNLLRSIRSYIRECSHPYYVLLAFFSAFSLISLQPMNAFSLFYAKSLAVPLEYYGKCIAVTYTISLLISYPLGWLCDRIHPLRVVIGCLVLYLASTASGYFLVHGDNSFLAFYLSHGVLAGIYLTASTPLLMRLLPKDRFAQFSSANGIVVSIFNMLMPPVIGKVLDSSGHNYRYIFLFGSALSIVSVIMGLILYQRFRQYGGDRSYLAP